ncbi:MAG: UDP-N-acetylmuramoyl-tripeptide--D-alanyl-D-alanine ligase [Desulfobacteraceae bacterium]|nr:MAG: UDP-N-acetylmuramoyl-tripeptide--D-alanyl-D-alanine ligase [Desulfobacteraceae bacterium]
MSAVWGEVTGREIISAIGGKSFSGDPMTVMMGLSTDSRRISKGDLFWALQGENFDGHDFVETAFSKGAAGAVIRRGREGSPASLPGFFLAVVEDTLKALGDFASWWRKNRGARVVAITGSAGKTSTKDMLFEVLTVCGMAIKTEGNLNNLIGLPLTVFRISPKESFAVLEMGMNRPGEIARLTEIADPDVGVITNVGMAHLEGVGDLEGVARAKTELVGKINPSNPVVINGDDALLMKAAKGYGRKMITFGINPSNLVNAREVHETEKGIRFRLVAGEESLPVTLPAHGVHNVMNALAASGAAVALGISCSDIVKGLERFKAIKGRLSAITLPGGSVLIDDTYNANPLSLGAALDALPAFVSSRKGRVIVGLGDMRELGSESRKAHREAGRMVAGIGAGLFLVIGDYAEEMAEGAAEGGMAAEQIEHFATVEEMAERLGRVVSGEDLVLLKASRKVGLDRVAAILKERKPVKGVEKKGHAL